MSQTRQIAHVSRECLEEEWISIKCPFILNLKTGSKCNDLADKPFFRATLFNIIYYKTQIFYDKMFNKMESTQNMSEA